MKEIAPMTKLTPNERYEETMKVVDKINGDEFQVGRARKMQGYQLNDPVVKLSEKNLAYAKEGSLNFRDAVK